MVLVVFFGGARGTFVIKSSLRPTPSIFQKPFLRKRVRGEPTGIGRRHVRSGEQRVQGMQPDVHVPAANVRAAYTQAQGLVQAQGRTAGKQRMGVRVA